MEIGDIVDRLELVERRLASFEKFTCKLEETVDGSVSKTAVRMLEVEGDLRCISKQVETLDREMQRVKEHQAAVEHDLKASDRYADAVYSALVELNGDVTEMRGAMEEWRHAATEGTHQPTEGTEETENGRD